ncbi:MULTISPECIES: NAD(P)-binding domain-containing protein [unclassified Actinopolyspora]|uniref:RraA family protein n=1 Tax=unclassified Actinopolyspora TaxID=2639451 RepID=UPI0013F61CFC|nr:MULTISPECIES: NAD(P)-binding domain-containing protein [unclassified Actinopolyspora]NHD19519.1 transferase [Actinopolyspora sp. BKK2]NHE78675.1 transferase [Actinopolyspora sp. BKK1]
MRIAVLGLGEAGNIYAAGFAAVGAAVVGYDPVVERIPEGVTRVDSVTEAVRGAQLVLSLVTAAHAVEVAAEVALNLERTAVYADLNAASPERKAEVAATLGDAAHRCADVAVIGSVPRFGQRTSLLTSGPASEEVAELFRTLGADVDAVGGQVGDASRRKILRTVFMKGLGAVITETVDAGELAGETEWVRAQIAGELVGGEAALDRLDRGTRKHALRRAHESEAATQLLESLGVAPLVTTAVSNRHRSLSRRTTRDVTELLEDFTRMPTAAIGDAGDRLGIVDPRVRPMWPAERLTGRALTVLCRPGDNKGIHQALTMAGPDDVLVVAGGGDPSRALIGELIAHRAINRGVRGVVVDGAVRDVHALREAGLPVWAVGTSPAGPYKSGPYRVGTDVALGGVVVHHGDIVVADSDGVTVVPLTDAERVLDGARAVLDDEASRYQRILDERVE